MKTELRQRIDMQHLPAGLDRCRDVFNRVIFEIARELEVLANLLRLRGFRERRGVLFSRARRDE
jgi:hypothetical protein